MAGGNDSKIKTIFVEAIELSGQQRAEFLNSACAGDPEMQIRIEALLLAAEEPGNFLRDPAIAGPTLERVPTEKLGTSIGPYRLLELIGEGGFGTVFLAEQREPVRRRVALKIIKLGMDTRHFIARFEQERQALAVMDHPNVAKVLDGGATATGRPFFVMELVSGQAITKYCDDRSLSIRDRVGLFLQVCAAVQHAHTKGIIHRDLKPGNILVSEQDGQAVAKVIDFGIAKAIDRPLTDKTVFTELRQMVGTPEYMSPEQAEGSHDIDTRTDVYSLGVLLYELLSGAPPFDPQRLRSAAYGEIQRMIREDEPPKPSTRLSRQTKTLSVVATSRSTEPARLGTLLRGELDWIVMHAMEKDRTRRYESASAFSADLSRYLAGEAVHAAPPSALYRARKFVRRHKFGVMAAGGLAAALIVGLGFSVWQAKTQAQLAEVAVAARLAAEKHQKELEKVAEFQASQLKGIDAEKMGKMLREDIVSKSKSAMQRAGRSPEEIAASQAQLTELLTNANLTNVALDVLDTMIFDRALKAVDAQFADQPVIRGGLLLTLADTLKDLGMYDKATAPQNEGLALLRNHRGDDAIETVNAIASTASLLKAQGKYLEAETLYREAMERTIRIQPESERVLTTMNNLALILQLQNKLKEAEPLYRESFEKREKLSGPDSAATIHASSNLGFLLVAQGKLSEAEPYLRRALEKQRRLATASPMDTLTMVSNLGAVLQMQGKLVEAEPLLREGVDVRRRSLGDSHAETLRAIHGLGVLLYSQGKRDEAEKLYREAFEGRKLTLKPGHPSIFQSMRTLGALLRADGKLAEAEPLLRDSLEGRKKVLGLAHVDTFESMNDVGVLMVLQGNAAQAEPLFLESLAGFEGKLGPQHWRTADVRAGLGECLGAQKKFIEAESQLIEAERVMAKAEGTPPHHYQRCLDCLVQLYEAWNQAELAADGVTDKATDKATKAAEWKTKRDTARNGSILHRAR